MRYSIFTILCLAACGGSSGSFVETDPIDDLPTFIEPEDDLAPTGSATYRGPMTLSFTPLAATTVNLEGTLGMTVNFDASTDAITGDVSDFETNAGGQVDGRLFLSGGTLDDNGSALLMASQLSGSLQSAGNGYLIFGQMTGELDGDDHSAMVGNVTGTARQAGMDSILTGDFLAILLP